MDTFYTILGKFQPGFCSAKSAKSALWVAIPNKLGIASLTSRPKGRDRRQILPFKIIECPGLFMLCSGRAGKIWSQKNFRRGLMIKGEQLLFQEGNIIAQFFIFSININDRLYQFFITLLCR